MEGGSMSEQYRDQFSNATDELASKSAYVCKDCNKQYSKSEADEKKHSCCGRAMTELLQEGYGP
jgi:transposase-like protein